MEQDAQSLWHPKSRPWAMELVDGERCFFLQGTQSLTVGGTRRNYECDDGWVIGDPDTQSPLWRAKYIEHDSVSTTDERIKVAWY